MQAHVKDTYVKKAQAQGFRSRAAYKLQEIDQRDHLLSAGQVVVDLGAAPGSWSQVIAARLGAKGLLVAVDLLPVAAISGVNCAGVQIIQGDFREAAVLAQVEKALAGRPVDLVVSDMAPNLSGVSSADQARSLELCGQALEFSCKHLKKGGNLLVKAFQGNACEEFRRDMARHFKTVQPRKPLASRDRSSELYLLGRGFLAVDPA